MRHDSRFRNKFHLVHLEFLLRLVCHQWSESGNQSHFWIGIWLGASHFRGGLPLGIFRLHPIGRRMSINRDWVSMINGRHWGRDRYPSYSNLSHIQLFDALALIKVARFLDPSHHSIVITNIWHLIIDKWLPVYSFFDPNVDPWANALFHIH